MDEQPQTHPLVLYDGTCGFCKIWIEYWKLLTKGRVDYASSRERGNEFPGISRDSFARSVQLVQPGGAILDGAKAVFTTLAYAGKRWPLWLYENVPLAAPASEAAYRAVASHRNAGYWLTAHTFGRTIRPSTFRLTSWLFLRLLGLVYLLAFLSLGSQVRGLLGAGGIEPASRFLPAVTSALGRESVFRVPTVFWVSHSDGMLTGVCYLGAALGLAVLLGVSSRAALAVLYLLYLSLVSVGQDFLSFQWDALLLEAGFLAIVLPGSRLVVWLFRWLTFRLFFLSGCVKLLSHDAAWRSLTALDYHYFTQPLPTPVAWYLAQLPAWFQAASTAFVFFAELFAPLLIFAPRRLRHFGAGVMVALQVLILLSGNYAFFNLLTLALCVFLFDDRALGVLPALNRLAGPPRENGRWERRAVAMVAVLVLTLGGAGLLDTFAGGAPAPLPSLQRAAAPFQIVNGYGLFAVMTTTRIEIIIQGSDDGIEWKDYQFPYKPGAPGAPPRWVAPFQPRLDWQMWFAALGNYRNNPWFISLLRELLDGAPAPLRLFRSNPFPSHPPKYVRALAYEYRFTDWATRRKTGNWWKRTLRGFYLPAVSLANFRS
jgi:predicted DCC family thiol-disulfide oxidoreductase YuxK